MAYNLRLKPNTKTPDAKYPYGNILDETPSVNGTPVDTEVYADFHQFFAKLFAESGLTYNNMPDNAYDGFQYYDALVQIIQVGILANYYNQENATWTAVTYANNWQNAFGSSYRLEYWKDQDGWVHLRGMINRSDGLTGNLVGVCILPVGYRPARDWKFVLPVNCASWGGLDSCELTISSAGAVTPESCYNRPCLGVLNAGSDRVVFDGVKFKTV